MPAIKIICLSNVCLLLLLQICAGCHYSSSWAAESQKGGLPKRITRVVAWMTWHAHASSQLLHPWLPERTIQVDNTKWFEHNPVFPIFWVCAELPTSHTNIETKQCSALIFTYTVLPSPLAFFLCREPGNGLMESFYAWVILVGVNTTLGLSWRRAYSVL